MKSGIKDKCKTYWSNSYVRKWLQTEIKNIKMEEAENEEVVERKRETKNARCKF